MPNSANRTALHRAVSGALATLLAMACGSPPPPPVQPPPAPPPTIRSQCIVSSETARDSGTIALAAYTADDSAMVRHQWALPPVRLDCTGKPSPGAAKAWTSDQSGRSWVRWMIPLDLRRIVVELEQPS
jgi:hypothetical protein